VVFKGHWFQPDHQPQKPRLQLLRRAGLRRLHYLLIDRGQDVGFGDPAGNAVDHPDLVGVHITGLKRRPDRWQARPPPAAASGRLSTHLVRLLRHQQRHLVGYELT